jgi:hypothetical protein
MFRRGNVAKIYLNTKDIYAGTANYTTPTWVELKYGRDINVELSHDDADAGHRLSLFNYQIGGKVRVEFDTELLVPVGDTVMNLAHGQIETAALLGVGLHFALADNDILQSGTRFFQGVFLPQIAFRHRHAELLVVELRGKLYPYPIEPNIVVVS